MESIKKKEINKFLQSLPGFDKIKSDISFFAFIKKYKKELEYFGDELFLLVDIKDRLRRDKKGIPLLAYRKDCHKKGSKNTIHRSSDFFIINNKGEILLSQRAKDKDTYPGFRDIGGGHCGLLPYEDTAKKEIKEEFGISPNKIASIKNIMKVFLKMNTQRQYTTFYEIHIKKQTKIKIDNEEVKKISWYPIKRIIENIQNNALNIIPEQTIYLLKYIMTKKLTKDTKAIKTMIKKQKIICEKKGIKLRLQVF